MIWPVKLLAGLAMVTGLILGYNLWSGHHQGIGETRATLRYETAIEGQKIEAGRVLAIETGKTRDAEKALNDFKHSQELQDAKNKNIVAGLERRLVAAAGPAGRLRDPQAPAIVGCGRGGAGPASADPASASDRADDAAQATGLLSVPLTALLRDLTLDADQVNLAYISCRADALHLRATLR